MKERSKLDENWYGYQVRYAMSNYGQLINTGGFGGKNMPTSRLNVPKFSRKIGFSWLKMAAKAGIWIENLDRTVVF